MFVREHTLEDQQLLTARMGVMGKSRARAKGYQRGSVTAFATLAFQRAPFDSVGRAGLPSRRPRSHRTQWPKSIFTDMVAAPVTFGDHGLSWHANVAPTAGLPL